MHVVFLELVDGEYLMEIFIQLVFSSSLFSGFWNGAIVFSEDTAVGAMFMISAIAWLLAVPASMFLFFKVLIFKSSCCLFTIHNYNTRFTDTIVHLVLVYRRHNRRHTLLPLQTRPFRRLARRQCTQLLPTRQYNKALHRAYHKVFNRPLILLYHNKRDIHTYV